MEHFYKLLKEYNLSFVSKVSDVPEWFFQYTENAPPLYWKTVYEILKHENRNQSIVEIGAGYGDITALLYFMGFHNIISFESDVKLVSHINDKIMFLFDKSANTINSCYPQKLDFTPDIIVQVNCIYSDNLSIKADFIQQIRTNFKKNGIPEMFIFETIDDSYQERNENFPKFMRLNRTDITKLFPKFQVESFVTYKYPQNKVSKTLYKICK